MISHTPRWSHRIGSVSRPQATAIKLIIAPSISRLCQSDFALSRTALHASAPKATMLSQSIIRK